VPTASALGRAALLRGPRLGELLSLRKDDLDFGRDLLKKGIEFFRREC